MILQGYYSILWLCIGLYIWIWSHANIKYEKIHLKRQFQKLKVSEQMKHLSRAVKSYRKKLFQVALKYNTYQILLKVMWKG